MKLDLNQITILNQSFLHSKFKAKSTCICIHIYQNQRRSISAWLSYFLCLLGTLLREENLVHKWKVRKKNRLCLRKNVCCCSMYFGFSSWLFKKLRASGGLMSKKTLVESGESKSDLRASGNRVTWNRVMRGLGVQNTLIFLGKLSMKSRLNFFPFWVFKHVFTIKSRAAAHLGL